MPTNENKRSMKKPIRFKKDFIQLLSDHKQMQNSENIDASELKEKVSKYGKRI